MATELTGIHQGSAYTGVEAIRPPDSSTHNRRPTTNDRVGFQTNHFWLYEYIVNPGIPAVKAQELWCLLSVYNHIAIDLFAAMVGLHPQIP